MSRPAGAAAPAGNPNPSVPMTDKFSGMVTEIVSGDCIVIKANPSGAIDNTCCVQGLCLSL